MELNKRKYSAKEVSRLLDEQEELYYEKFKEQKNRIDSLIDENKILNATLDEYKQKEKFIESTMVKAQKDAYYETEKAKMQYQLTVEKLRNFYQKWKDYFSYLIEKYPQYSEVKKANEIILRLKNALKISDNTAIVDTVEKEISSKDLERKVFNPKQLVNDYISSTGNNGFNLDEVLNPGELQLEDLCKELGLLDE